MRLTLALLTLLCCLDLSLPASAVPSYTVTDLGALGGNTSQAAGISSGGVVAGSSATGAGAYHAFRWAGGKMKDLGTLGGSNSFGYAINSATDVVGAGSLTGDTAEHACLFSHVTGLGTDLGSLGGSSIAYGINASGQVTGTSYLSDGTTRHAFLYSGGSMTDLGTLGGPGSLGMGINDSGQVAGVADRPDGGYHAVLYSGGSMTDLGALGGANSTGLALNAPGQVVGQADTGVAHHAFLYSGGAMTDLGTLGGKDSQALAINTSGQVVGTSGVATGDVPHAFLYAAGTLLDLNAYVPADSGWVLYAATGINDAGTICGYGRNANHQTHAFLLSPVAYQPDLTIAAHGDVAYLGAGLYNLTGAGQTKTQPVELGSAVVYNLQITDAGESTDSFVLQGTTGDPWWTVKFYDQPDSGGNDITSQVTGSGWTVGPLASGAARTFRLEITSRILGPDLLYTVKVTAGSLGSSGARDAVVAVATLTGPRYTVLDLGTLGGSSSWAGGLNASGQVTGDSLLPDGSDHAFLYSGGVMTDLGTLGGGTSWGMGVNAAGQVAGAGYLPDGISYHAFVYSSGKLTDLGTLGGNKSEAAAINASGQVAGDSYLADGINYRAFVASGGKMSALGTLGGGSSWANGINDAGLVAGGSLLADDLTAHAFLYSGGAMADLGTLGGTTSDAAAVNASGQVVGWSMTTDDAAQHAFRRAGRQMTDLGGLGGDSAADAINGLGQVVGYSYLAGGTTRHAFLYSGGTMVDLNAYLFNGTGWTLEEATGITDAGLICGYGYNPRGQEHAFLLAPSPYQPDLMIQNLGEASYIGAHIYNLTGAGQTKAQTVTFPARAVYNLKIANAGGKTDSFTLKATAGTTAWGVKYFDAAGTGGADITSQITGAGWSVGPLANGQSRAFRVEVSPAAKAGLAYTVRVTATSVGRPSLADVAVATTTAGAFYQPDATIRVKGVSPIAYLGGGTYNATGLGQTVAATTGPGRTVTYLLRLYNAGNATDAFTVAGPKGPSAWTVAYFDADSGGNDITAQVTGAGWTTPAVGSQGTDYVDFRVEVTPGATVPGGASLDVLVTARSTHDPRKADAVKATTTNARVYQPDATIRVQGASPIAYVGAGVFNYTGLNQTVTATAAAGKTVVYLVRLYNAGNVADTFTVTGPAGGSGWTVAYFNADRGGTDITSQVTGPGWTTPSVPALHAGYTDFRVEVTPDSTVTSGDALSVLLTCRSAGDTTKVDAVKGTTTKG